MNQKSKSRVQIEANSKGLVAWAFSEGCLFFSIEKEPELPVVTRKKFGSKSNNSFFVLWMLIGLLSFQLFALSQLPKMITVFQDVVLEEPQQNWVRE